MKTVSIARLFVLAALGTLGLGGCGDDGINHLPDAPQSDGGTDAPPSLPGLLRLTPISADFGSVVIGQSSVPVAITVANVGQGPTGSISAALSGAMGSNFSIASTDCTTLAPAATCTVSVAFTPGTAGAKTALLAVTASPGGTVMASLDGIGLAPGALMITPSTRSFGTVLVGQTTTTTTFNVTNTGGVPTSALTTGAGGSNPGEFPPASDTCNGQILGAGESCMFTVAFAPQAAGSKFASYTIQGSPGGTVVAALSGVGVAPAQLVVNPSSGNFGTVVINTASSTTTFTVANIGGAPSGSLSHTLNGATTEFTVVTSTCSGAVLNPASACTITARFNPTSLGAKSAQINLSGTPGGALTINLNGTGIAAGQLVISPSTHAFANTTVGGSSVPQIFMVTNTGGTTSGTLSTGVTGSAAGQFPVGANTCQGTTLAAGVSCTVSVTFAPTSAGVRSATLNVSGMPGGAVQASLSGNALPPPQLTITPVSKDYGSVGVGTITGYQVFTVQNQGGAPTGPPTIMLTGPNVAQFSPPFLTDCSGALLPLATCEVRVRYAPTALGSHTATASVSASPGGTTNASLFGQGVNPAALSVNPSSLPFPGITLIGDTSPSLSFTVTNNGGGATGLLSINKAGTHAGEFTIVGTTCSTLAAGGTCTVTVAFLPAARGSRTASITVSGSPGGSVSVGVSGDALPRLEILSVDEGPPVDPYNFGNVTVGSNSYVILEVRNNTLDDHPFGIAESYGLPAQFRTDWVSCGGGKSDFAAVGPGGRIIGGNGGLCYVWVAFNPTSEGGKTGSITFDIGPSVLDQAAQGLRGNGVIALTLAAVTVPNFGNVVVGGSSGALRFRLTNAFDAPQTGTITTLAASASYVIVDDDCGGSTLWGGDTCDLLVEFRPTVLGPSTAGLSASASPGGTAALTLSGSGVDPNSLVFNPTPLDFSDVFMGETKQLSLTVTNPAGAQPSGVLTFSIGGGTFVPGSPFRILPPQAGDCVSGATLLVGGQSCTVRVEFDSESGQLACGGFCSQFGPRSGQITFAANPGTPGNVYISLSANVRSTISISPTYHDFGTLDRGQAASQELLVRNDSPVAATVAPLSTGWTNYTLTADLCSGVVLPPNGQCKLVLTFAPTVSLSGQIQIYVRTVDFTGEAIAYVDGIGRAPDVSFDLPTSHGFGTFDPCGVAVPHSFTLRNSGTLASDITGVSLDNTTHFAVSHACGTLAPGGVCTVDVTFVPQTCPGTFSAMVEVTTSNDGAEYASATGDCSSGICNK